MILKACHSCLHFHTDKHICSLFAVLFLSPSPLPLPPFQVAISADVKEVLLTDGNEKAIQSILIQLENWCVGFIPFCWVHAQCKNRTRGYITICIIYIVGVHLCAFVWMCRYTYIYKFILNIKHIHPE